MNHNELPNEELLDTCFMFAKNNMNISKTSKDMFVSRGTVEYRLNMVKRKTNQDPKTFYGLHEILFGGLLI